MRYISKTKIRLILLLMLSVVFAVFLFIIKNQGAKAEAVKVIYVGKVLDGSDFWSQCIEGITMAAEEYGVDLLVTAPEREDDYVKQNEMITWAIEQDPSAILLTPASYTYTVPYAKEILSHGISLVLVDSELAEDLGVTIVSTDNKKAGAKQGAYMKEMLGGDDKIAVIGHVKNSSTAMEREEGLRQGLSEEQAKIVDVVFCDSDYDKSYKLLKQLLDQYPDLTMVAGLNEYSAVGAARALKDLHKDSVRMIGFDSSIEEIQLLEQGILEAIVIQKPFKMGFMGMEVAVKLSKGEDVLKRIDSGSELITRENMYSEENQKLLFPFDE